MDGPASAHERVAVALTAIQLPQLEIARLSEVTAQYLSHVKTGARPLSETLALKLERTFGISLGWLMTGMGTLIVDEGKARQYIVFALEYPVSPDRRADMVFWDSKGKMHIIRPFVYIEEELLKKFASESHLPILPRRCPMDGQTRRQKIKKIIANLQKEEKNANIRENIFKSLRHVNIVFPDTKDPETP